MNELPLSQLKCLHVIASEEGQKMQDVARNLEMKLPAVSQIVDRLVKRGLVERHSDPQDRRVVRLALAERAQAMLSADHAIRQARMTATGKNLTLESMKRVTEGLALLAEAAERVEAEERQSSVQTRQDADPFVELISRRTRSASQNTAVGVSPADRKSRP